MSEPTNWPEPRRDERQVAPTHEAWRHQVQPVQREQAPLAQPETEQVEHEHHPEMLTRKTPVVVSDEDSGGFPLFCALFLPVFVLVLVLETGLAWELGWVNPDREWPWIVAAERTTVETPMAQEARIGEDETEPKRGAR